MSRDELLQLSTREFQRRWDVARTLSKGRTAGPGQPAPLPDDPPPTFEYSGYLDIEGFYWFHLDVIGFSAQDYNFHGSGSSWIFSVAQCEMVGPMVTTLNTLSGVTIDFSLVLGAVGGGGAQITFTESKGGSVLGTLTGAAQGLGTGYASGSGTFAIPS